MADLALPDLVAAARETRQPILIYFVADYSIDLGVYRRLDRLFHDPVVVRTVAENFWFKLYQRGVGAGVAAGASLGVNHLLPVILVLTSDGDVVRRWVVETVEQVPATALDFAVSLTFWARDARAATPAVVEQAEDPAASLPVLVEAAERAWATADLVGTQRWLRRVEDGAGEPALAARAAWQSALVQSTAEVHRTWTEQANSYLERHPAYGLPAVAMLAAAGAEVEVLDRGVEKVLRAADDRSITLDLNGIAYDALEWGATGGALAAASMQVDRHPDQPNAWDTLAQVLSARGQYAEAVDAAEHGLGLGDLDPQVRCSLLDTLAHARSEESGTIEYTCRRRLGRAQLRVPGEDQLFQQEFPSALARRELTPRLTALAEEMLVARTEDVVVRVRLAAEGEPLDVEVLSSSVSEDDARRLRDAAGRELVSPFDAPGLEFFTSLPLHR